MLEVLHNCLWSRVHQARVDTGLWMVPGTAVASSCPCAMTFYGTVPYRDKVCGWALPLLLCCRSVSQYFDGFSPTRLTAKNEILQRYDMVLNNDENLLYNMLASKLHGEVELTGKFGRHWKS